MTVLEAFGRASECGGIAKQYAQGFYAWHKDAPNDKSGACFGLSIMWIIETRKGKSLFDAIGEETELASDDTGAVDKFNQQVNNRYTAGKLTKGLNKLTQEQGIDVARQKQNAMFAAYKVTPRIEGGQLATKTVSGATFQYSAAGDLKTEQVYPIVIENAAVAIIEHPNSSVLIHRKDHTMAAHVGNGREIRFFDPNGGEAQFPPPDNFKRWFTEYWGKVEEYKKSYSFILEYYN
jgi:YopT-type cysteine protease-like protein